MSSSGKIMIQKTDSTRQTAAKNPKENAQAVPLSCAAEVRNTLPAAFALVETVNDPGFYLQAGTGKTSNEHGDLDA